MSFSGFPADRRAVLPAAKFQRLEGALDDPRAVIGVDDVEAGPQAGNLRFDPELACGKAVEGAEQDGAGPLSSAARIRLLISVAALLVKVTARTRPGATPPAAIRCTTAAVNVFVLPVPAPASTRTGP